MPQITAPASSPTTSQPAIPADNGGHAPDTGFGQALGQAQQDHATSASNDTSASQSAHTGHEGHDGSKAGDTPSGPHDHTVTTDAAKADGKHRGSAARQNGRDGTDTASVVAVPLPAAVAAALRSTLAGHGGRSLPAAATGVTGKAAARDLKSLQDAPRAGATSTHDRQGDTTLLDSLKTAATTDGKTGTGNAAAIDAALTGRLSLGNGKSDTRHATDAAALPLNALASLQPTPAVHAAAGVPQLQINTPPTSPDFAQALSQHVAWMGNQEIKQATIHLNPRDLGPLNVNVQVNQGQVDVSFAVQHPGTVHALQQTLPQLDSLLAQHGLSLGQAHVGHQQQGHAGQGQGAGASTADAIDGEVALEPVAAARPLALGLVDDFA